MDPVFRAPGFHSRHRPSRFSYLLIFAIPLLRLTAGLTAAAPLIEISISPEGRVKASAGEAKPLLVQGDWTEFEIVIDNTAGLTSPLAVESLQLLTSAGDVSRARWLKLEIVPPGPLSGKPEETRILRLWSRDAGRRAAVFNINAGQGSQDLGFRSDVLLTFVVKPASTAATPGFLSPWSGRTRWLAEGAVRVSMSKLPARAVPVSMDKLTEVAYPSSFRPRGCPPLEPWIPVNHHSWPLESPRAVAPPNSPNPAGQSR